MYVYIQTEKAGYETVHDKEVYYPGLWTVGFYEPSGQFIPESDHSIPDEAAKRVHYLNGGK